DTTNACYGGTAAIFHAVDWIESSSWDGRYAIVVAGDIAIYSEGNARPTGGAGSVAMLIGPNAPLVFDRGVRATHMGHTYDFYKPILSSEYPVVDGKLSVVCYTECVDKCYQLFREKFERNIQSSKGKPMSLNNDFDALLLHSPYCKLVQKSVARMLFNEFQKEQKPDFQGFYKGLENLKNVKLEDTYFDKGVETTFVKLSSDLFATKTKPSLFLASEVGNMYTTSLYSCLVSYLLSKPLSKMEGKRLLLFSYGSGMAASMYTIKISSDSSPGSPLDRLYAGIKDVPQRIADRQKVSPKDFVDILKLREGSLHAAPYKPIGKIDKLFPGTYHLTSVDEMYRRTYEKVARK
ncbi:hydroxymethylglutaryl-CoA synthase 1-like isoform X1, partial [Leptotrombidium deliense]